MVARIGGDELAALLPNTNSAKVQEIVERIKANIAAFNSHGNAPRLRLSLGAAIANKGEPLAQALKQADEQMYRDKNSNRTRRDSKWTDSTSPRGN